MSAVNKVTGDAAILAACATFLRADSAVEASNASNIATQEDWAEMVDKPGRAWWVALDAIIECGPAKTPEGRAAKAQAAFAALKRHHCDLAPDWRDADTKEAVLALSALSDVMEGRPA